QRSRKKFLLHKWANHFGTRRFSEFIILNKRSGQSMKKSRVFPLVVMSAALMLSACAGFQASSNSGESNTNDDGKTVVDFWSFWGSEIRRPIIDKIVADFNASQDEIEVKHTYSPWGDIWTKELAAIAAGNPPDVVINDINATAIRGQEQQAMNLS